MNKWNQHLKLTCMHCKHNFEKIQAHANNSNVIQSKIYYFFTSNFVQLHLVTTRVQCLWWKKIFYPSMGVDVIWWKQTNHKRLMMFVLLFFPFQDVAETGIDKTKKKPSYFFSRWYQKPQTNRSNFRFHLNVTWMSGNFKRCRCEMHIKNEKWTNNRNTIKVF